MQEQWTVNAAGTVAAVTGRMPLPLAKKLNPLWWFGNEAEPAPPSWYASGEASWWRTVKWYLRNPLQNFGNYVVGVCDRNYIVVGVAPVRMVILDDASPPRLGWKWSVIKLGLWRLPFFSYAGRYVLAYAGWQPNGFFGFKVNLRGAALPQLW